MTAPRLSCVLIVASLTIAATRPTDARADGKQPGSDSAGFQVRAAYRVPLDTLARSRELVSLAHRAVKEATTTSGSKTPVLSGTVTQSQAGDKYAFSAGTRGGLQLSLNTGRRVTFRFARFEADLSRPAPAAIAADHHLQFTAVETDAKGKKSPQWNVESRRATPPRDPKSFRPPMGKALVLAVAGKLTFDGVECNVKLRMQGTWSQPIVSTFPGMEEITDWKLSGTIGLPSQTIAIGERHRDVVKTIETKRGRIRTDHTSRTINSMWTGRNGVRYRFANTVIAGGRGSGNVPARIGESVAGKILATRPGRKSEMEIGRLSRDKSRRVVLTLKDAAGSREIVLDPRR